MTGTDIICLRTNQSRSYLNHLVFYCICAFCWYVEDIIYGKMHGMESFEMGEKNVSFREECDLCTAF